MVDTESEDEHSPQITITLKSTAQNHQLTVADNSTIGKVKELLAEKINQSVEKICLIFSGKILKDHETLTTHNIKDGMAIHMVIRSTPATTGSNVSSSRPAATTSASTGTTATSTSNAPSAGPTIPGMPPGMNMESARQLLNSPFMQQMMNNPDVIRNMLSGNEHIQNLARQNPEIGHLLNDPEIIRQTMEMIRNPNMFNEMMRNHDQAIRNLQGIPGGEAALQRLYQDIQEPLLNSATSGSNPFAGGNNTANIESRSQRAGVENAEALPNPWGGGSTPAAGNRQSAGSDNTSGGQAASGAGGLDLGNFAGMMNNPAMQETMRSMMSNPEFMRQMMSPEMIQQARSLLGDSVNLPGNEELSRMATQMSGMMGNPDFATALMNPRVIEALNNIRTSIDVIRTEAPSLYQNMFQGVMSSMNTMQGSGNTTTAAGNNTTTNTATDAAAGTGATPSGGNALFNNPQLMMNLLNQMSLGGAGGLGGLNSNLPPEERYRSQLDQLVGMGFNNREANIRALQDTNGDVNAAIDRLLNP